MQLPNENLTVQEQLAEFDQWLTAKLERIKDTDKFNSEIESLCKCIQHLAQYLDDFSKPEKCSIEALNQAVINASKNFVKGEEFFEDEQRIFEFYNAFFNLLFLVTGATDNNLKNHFLIKLKDSDVSATIPKRTGKKNIKFSLNDLPATTKADYVAKLLASYYVGTIQEFSKIVRTEPFFDLNIYLNTYLREYIALILEDEDEILQLWAMCRSYIELSGISKDVDFGKYLLNSCTIFKVRGSVSASGGHITEEILREKLQTLGLRPNVDYNCADVNIGEQEVVEGGRCRKKTRAYDFILPFQIDEWKSRPKLFIQSQFYAGDSGSVSHKVVDQTQSSRQFTLEKYPKARFVEYLDGAGYYAALRGDLEHMLTFDDTHSFLQVKSILVRLRREFQSIDFITPVELEHAIILTADTSREKVFNHLIEEGYPLQEIERAEQVSLTLGYITLDNNRYVLAEERTTISQKLFILDTAANHGRTITDAERKSG